MNGLARRIDQYLGVFAVAALAIGSFAILSPFLPALLWAIILVVSTWPLFTRLDRALRGRTWLAAGLLTLFFAGLFLLPVIIIAEQLAVRGPRLLGALRQAMETVGPAAPGWVAKIPLVGETLARQWETIIADLPQLVEFMQPYLLQAAQLLLGLGTWFGGAVFQIVISFMVAFFLYRGGYALLDHVRNAAARVGGENGVRLLEVSSHTMRAVVYGILGAAVAQGVSATIGLWIAGVPAALLLGLVVGVVAMVPVGLTVLTMLCASLWLFYTGQPGWGVFLLAWTVLVTTQVDNVVQPFIISRGTKLPLIVTLLGVLGGVLMAGILGIFVGATVLGVFYTLVAEWTQASRQPAQSPGHPLRHAEAPSAGGKEALDWASDTRREE